MKKEKTLEQNNRAGLEDEFSSQPDSGSSIGGRRGREEYGIRGGIAAEQGDEPIPVIFADEDNLGGISDYALKSSGAATVEDAADAENEPNRRVKQRELRAIFADRLKKHPVLKHRHIELEISTNGEIILVGEVESAAEKMDARELAEAVAEQIGIENRLQVRGKSEHARM